jgi:hypothetical protein
MTELGNLLGKFNNDGHGGQEGCFWNFYSYRLDDRTQLIVEFSSKSGHDDPELILIVAKLPDGQLVQLGGIVPTGNTLHSRIASNLTSDNAPTYHHYDNKPARHYVSDRQSLNQKSTQYADGSSGSRDINGNKGAFVSSETLQGVTQK